VLCTPLWLYLLIAFLVRAWLIIHSSGVIDGDESIVGIQAEHILHGELPIYFYGQPYMGSLEAYLVALLFALAGPSVWALRAEPLLLSLVIVWLTWNLAAKLADLAHLSDYARRCFMHVAALIAAIPPLYDTVLELRTLGGYVEIFVLMLLLLLLTLQLLYRWSKGAALWELAAYWAGIGLVVGLGFWVNPLLVFAVVAVGIWILGYCISTTRRMNFGRLRSCPTSESGLFAARQARQEGQPLWWFLAAALAAVPAAAVGSFPALYWGAQNQWENVQYLVRRGGSTQAGNVGNLALHYFQCVAPQVLGGPLSNESLTLRILHVLPVLLGSACAIGVVLLVGASLLVDTPLLQSLQRLAALPLLFGLCNVIFFCIGTGPINCSQDYVSRYATPIMLVLPFYYASVCTAILLWLYERQAQQQVGDVDQAAVQEATPARRLTVSNFGLAGLFIILLVTVCSQTLSYRFTDAGSTFQSPSCTYAPANDELIISYMQHEPVHYAWGISWIGYPIVFKTNGGIIVADPRPVLKHSSNLGRIPAYVVATQGAERPSMLVFVKHGDVHPLLLRTLDMLGVTYRAAFFPSQPGVDVLLATPVNRTVPLSASDAFLQVFTNC
jgi:hypothetical protein